MPAMIRVLVLSTLSFGLACGSAASQSASMPQCPSAPPAKAVAKAAPVVEGYWTGVLAGKLHVALRLRRAGYTGMLDSIDQGAKLQVENVTLDGATVRFEIPAVKGRFEGKLADDGSHLEGTWVQGAAPVPQPLAFEKGTAPPETAEPAKKLLDAPIEVTAPIAPVAFRANGHRHLAYELHVTSYARSPISIGSSPATTARRAAATHRRTRVTTPTARRRSRWAMASSPR